MALSSTEPATVGLRAAAQVAVRRSSAAVTRRSCAARAGRLATARLVSSSSGSAGSTGAEALHDRSDVVCAATSAEALGRVRERVPDAKSSYRRAASPPGDLGRELAASDDR